MNEDTREQIDSKKIERNVEHTLAQVDALFDSSQGLKERGREEIVTMLTTLSKDAMTEMGQQAWGKYSDDVLGKLDGLFQTLGLDKDMQNEILLLVGDYIDLEVEKGLGAARAGLSVLGQAIDVRLSREGTQVRMEQLTADFDFGPVESNFLYAPETGFQFKVDASTGEALISMAGSLKGGNEKIDSARATIAIRGTAMELVKMGDSYEVTVKLGDHLRLSSSLDPNGGLGSELSVPFREGTLQLAPNFSFDSNGNPNLHGLSMKLVGQVGQLDMSYNGTVGSIAYGSNRSLPSGREVQVAGGVSRKEEITTIESTVSVLF